MPAVTAATQAGQRSRRGSRPRSRALGEDAAERDRGLVQVFLGQHGLADEGARLQAGPPLGFADVEQFGGGDLAGLSVRGGHEGSNTRGRTRAGAGPERGSYVAANYR